MKKLFFKPTALIALLLVVMISTVAVSFTYWKSGIEGNNTDTTLGVTIGEGKSLETTVDLNTAINDTTLRLIPKYRTPLDGANQTNIIEITIPVKWTTSASLNTGEVTNFTTHTGTLTVDCTKIMLGDTDVTNTKGYSNLPLFEIKSTASSYSINGSYGSAENVVDVVISVQMNEPLDKAQYEQVINAYITFTLNFTIMSEYDQLIP